MDNARKFRRSLMLVSKIILVLSLIAMMIWTWWFKYPEAAYYIGGNFLVVFLYAILVIVFSTIYSATKIGVLRLGEIIYSFSITLLISNTLIYIVFSLIARSLLSPLWIGITMLAQLLLAVIGAWFMNKLYFRLYPPREMVLIYSNKPKAYSLINKMIRRGERYRVCVALSDEEYIEDIYSAIDRHGAVTLCQIDPAIENKIFLYCNQNNKRIYILPTIQDVSVRYSNTTQLFDTPLFYCKNSGPTTEQLILKRAMDIVISAVALIVVSPILLVTAIAIKLYDKGPVIYKQNRLTLERKVFEVYKFRSMKVNAEQESGIRLSGQNDDRITPIGKIIRKLRIDEFPQLFNILKGEMSLVGPRPERPEIATEYEKHIPQFALRLQMKAGLTGYAQVYGNYNTDISDKLLLDMIYIESYSILLDFNILFMTVKIIFMPDVTEGVAENASLPADIEEMSKKK